MNIKQRFLPLVFLTYVQALAIQTPAANPHVWEMQEITLRAEATYANYYNDVTVWIDLKGPDFSKRIYGFWDGDSIFRVRFVATKPGQWEWISSSNQKTDAGLNGKTGRFTAEEWTEKEKQENKEKQKTIPKMNGFFILRIQ